MALGIDIYRYQTVTDWNSVKRHGVKFVIVKATDGGNKAIVLADNQVRGAKSVDIPVGLYHYAQLSPTPEVQANILTGEVHRLKAYGVPPALDLEDPHKPGAAAKDFTLRFIAQMRRNGFRDVLLYANTSMLAGIGGPEIDDDPHVGIWAAAYGRNDGRRHPLNYRGRVNIHQYASVGAIPGISGQVDLNESLTPIPGVDLSPEEDVALKDEKIRFWQEAGGPLGDAAGWYEIPANETIGWIHNYSQGAARDAAINRAQSALILDAVTGEEITPELIGQKVGEELDKRPAAPVDMDAIKAAVREELGQDNEDLADRVVNGIGRRLIPGVLPEAEAEGPPPGP